MTTFAEHQAAPNEEAETEARTGLSRLPRWPLVYRAVLVIFVVTVLVMWGFQRYYA